MAGSRPITRALMGCLLGAWLAACSSTPSASPTGSGAGSVPGGGTPAAATVAPGATQGSTAGGGGGSTADICTAMSAADISSLLGKPVTANGPVAGEAQSCSWYTDDLTNVYLYRTDPGECDDTKASLTAIGPVQGADFAGSSAALGATFAGAVRGGSCYVVEVSPTERAPQPAVLSQLLLQLLQVMGA